MINEIIRVFEVEEDIAKADLYDFLKTLNALGIIEHVTHP